jgi:hypothetical protein
VNKAIQDVSACSGLGGNGGDDVCPRCEGLGEEVSDCRGCIHSRYSGYAYWCAKDGCKCSRGGVPKQTDCFQPNIV